MTKVGHQGWLELSLTKGNRNNFVRPFAPKFDTVSTKIMKFNDAADYTAKLIANQYNNLYLSLSGGLDSEFVAKVLLRNHIAFTPIILLAPWNRSEVWYAFKFCEDNNLTPKILDYTQSAAYHAVVKNMAEYSVRLQLPVWITTLPLIVADTIGNGHLITGSGEIFNDSESYQVPMGDLFNFVCYNHWLEIEHGSKHPGAFFSYTPELFRAGIADIDTSKNSQVAKSELYQIPFRPKMHNDPFGYYPLHGLDAVINNLRAKMPAIKHCRIQRNDLLNRLT